MYLIIWEYRVKADRLAEFEKAYSENGTWVELFRKSPGFLGTELLADSGLPARFITIDRWASAREYEAFRSTWKLQYAELDAQLEPLTEREILIGKWEAIP